MLNYQQLKDSTTLTVLTDPRFELAPGVDKTLYQYQKSIDLQVRKLAGILGSIDTKLNRIDSLKNQLSHADSSNYILLLKDMDILKSDLQSTRSKGQTPKPIRQLGAWQTSIISPYSKVKDVLMIAMARTRLPSESEWTLLQDAINSVMEYEQEVHLWVEKKWTPFVKELDKSGLN